MRHIPSLCLVGFMTLAHSCKTPHHQHSETKSVALVSVTVAIAESLLQTFFEVSLHTQMATIYQSIIHHGERFGDVNDAEVTANSTVINSPVTKDFQLPLKIKLNSLQDTLSRDYVAGSPDSTNLLALMIDKANDIRSSIEEHGSPDSGPNYAADALASYQSYLLISSLSLSILQERVRSAKASGTLSPEVIAKLRGSVLKAAKENALYIKKLYGPLFEAYARKNMLTYTMTSAATSVDFGFEKGVSYTYCVQGKSGPDLCGERSQTRCATEMNADCVQKAQEEAKANCMQAGHEQKLITAARKTLFAIDLAQFADKMEARAGAQ